MPDPDRREPPRASISVLQGVAFIVGIVTGIGIFRSPQLVAQSVTSETAFIVLWAIGGLLTLVGALVYAELGSAYPSGGGEYHFLSRALGRPVALLFAWARVTVLQTGIIAAVAFVFGDYASEILRLGDKSSAIYAAIGVVALTALNVAGTLQSKGLQKVMQYLLFAGLVFLVVAGLLGGAPAKPAAAASGGSFGLAMIFVLLTFGGWNEAAYLSGEVRDARRNMIRILLFGILTVTVIYLLVNVAYLTALGLGGMKESKAVAADLTRLALGDKGAVLIALIVCLATLTTMNAAVFTGARTTYALGRDFAFFGTLGAWREAGSTPANALLVQGAITLVLVVASAVTPDGFSAMVAYTSPVFWTFFLLTAITLFVFRRSNPEAPFRVPLYPVVPIAFCIACLYMLYSSINYVRFAVEFGVAVFAGLTIMVLGIPLYFIARNK
jgi:amino acid transporter